VKNRCPLLRNVLKAEQHIADGERRAAEQIILIGQMTETGQERPLPGNSFEAWSRTLVQWHAHRRRLILEAIAEG